MARNVIKVLQEKDHTVHALIKGTSTATMNAIRRTVMSEVAALAIEELSLYENNGVLFDEFLGHRIGMVPITTDPTSYKLGDKVKISLDVAGPGTVYSRDIKIADKGIEVVDGNIPITKLKADQKVRLEGEAVMGQGRDHVKFQPAVIGYHMLPMFTINETIPVPMMEKIAASCPVNIIEIRGKKLNITEAANCTQCGNCEETGGAQNIQVDTDDTGFILMMESHGGMTNKQILHEACNVLLSKTKRFTEQIKEGL